MIDPARWWVAYVEQAARSRQLEAELERLKLSRSWRVTAPLRWLLDRVRPPATGRPELLPPGEPDSLREPRPELPAWLPAGLRARRAASANLYVDVTQLALEDLGAGVQRVTRCVLNELMVQPPADTNVVPVRLASDGRHYAANRFVESAYGLAAGCLGAEAPVEPRAGDAYLGLDFCREHTGTLSESLKRMRSAGVPVALVVHDLLPLDHPTWFPAVVSADFEAWLHLLVEQADVALCISESTREALSRQLAARGLVFDREAVAVPLGADALTVLAPPGKSARSQERRVPSVLMVGTVEPRKGHDEVLDVFDTLWSEGMEIRLVVAGKAGWHVQGLVERLRTHPQRGRLLHWAEGPDDAALALLFSASDVLLMASRGEGYGLPVGEAATAGCRLLLRDLPVFREVAGGRARYFDSPEALASALRDVHRSGVASWPDPAAPAWPTWAQTASALAAAAMQRRAFHEVAP